MEIKLDLVKAQEIIDNLTKLKEANLAIKTDKIEGKGSGDVYTNLNEINTTVNNINKSINTLIENTINFLSNSCDALKQADTNAANSILKE